MEWTGQETVSFYVSVKYGKRASPVQDCGAGVILLLFLFLMFPPQPSLGWGVWALFSTKYTWGIQGSGWGWWRSVRHSVQSVQPSFLPAVSSYGLGGSLPCGDAEIVEDRGWGVDMSPRGGSGKFLKPAFLGKCSSEWSFLPFTGSLLNYGFPSAAQQK